MSYHNRHRIDFKFKDLPWFGATSGSLSRYKVSCVVRHFWMPRGGIASRYRHRIMWSGFPLFCGRFSTGLAGTRDFQCGLLSVCRRLIGLSGTTRKLICTGLTEKVWSR